MRQKLDGFDADAVLFLPRKTIHPDPDQPRVKPDDELQASRAEDPGTADRGVSGYGLSRLAGGIDRVQAVVARHVHPATELATPGRDGWPR